MANGTELAAVRRLIEGEVPGVEPALRDLAAATGAIGEAAAAGRTAELLRLAVRGHAADGDQPCPLCRFGHLDDAWRAAAEAEITRLESIAVRARATLAAAEQTADQDLAVVRRELSTAAAALAWALPGPAARLRDVVSGLPGAAAGVTAVQQAWPEVVSAYAELAEAATRWLVRAVR